MRNKFAIRIDKFASSALAATRPEKRRDWLASWRELSERVAAQLASIKLREHLIGARRILCRVVRKRPEVNSESAWRSHLCLRCKRCKAWGADCGARCSLSGLVCWRLCLARESSSGRAAQQTRRINESAQNQFAPKTTIRAKQTCKLRVVCGAAKNARLPSKMSCARKQNCKHKPFLQARVALLCLAFGLLLQLALVQL